MTIATNMAGRGTDIKLGGNIEMRLKLEAAGIADPAERAGARGGDPRRGGARATRTWRRPAGCTSSAPNATRAGASTTSSAAAAAARATPAHRKFFLSLEDDLMRIFGSDRMGGMLHRLGLKDGEAIVHPWINKALEKAQKKVEARNFDTRKNVLRYDDVMNDQRKEVYAQRREFMKAHDVSDAIADMRTEVIGPGGVPGASRPRRSPSNGNRPSWPTSCGGCSTLDLPIVEWAREEGIDEEHILERIEQAADAAMAAKAANFGPDLMRFVEKSLLLQVLDAVWKEHLLALDHLRQGIGLRAYGQRDPLNEYKSEAFALFNAMLDELKERVTVDAGAGGTGRRCAGRSGRRRRWWRCIPEPAMALAGAGWTADYEMAEGGAAHLTTQPIRSEAVDPKNPATWRNSPRNAPCPCGSGKKFKHCHGRNM